MILRFLYYYPTSNTLISDFSFSFSFMSFFHRAAANWPPGPGATGQKQGR